LIDLARIFGPALAGGADGGRQTAAALAASLTLVLGVILTPWLF